MNVVADIGNSQIKIAIDRKNDISRVKAFRLNDFVNIKKYLKSLNHNTKSDLFYSSKFPLSSPGYSELLYLSRLVFLPQETTQSENINNNIPKPFFI